MSALGLIRDVEESSKNGYLMPYNREAVRACQELLKETVKTVRHALLSHMQRAEKEAEGWQADIDTISQLIGEGRVTESLGADLLAKIVRLGEAVELPAMGVAAALGELQNTARAIQVYHNSRRRIINNLAQDLVLSPAVQGNPKRLEHLIRELKTHQLSAAEGEALDAIVRTLSSAFMSAPIRVHRASVKELLGTRDRPFGTSQMSDLLAGKL